MQAYDETWSPRPVEGATAGRQAGLGGLHAVRLEAEVAAEPEAAAAAPLTSDLMAFLSDFRAAQFAPAPADDGGTSAGAANGGGDVAGGGAAGLGGGWGAADEYYDPYEGRSAPAGPGWWQASDRLWYPPELHPDAQVAAEEEAGAPGHAAGVSAGAAGVPAAAAGVPAADAAAGAPGYASGAPGQSGSESSAEGEGGRGRLRFGRLGRKG